MRSPLVLFWSPRSLAMVAMTCSDFSAVLLGGASLGMCGTAVLVGISWGMGEPYPTLRAYFTDVNAGALVLLAVVTIMCWVMLGVVLVLNRADGVVSEASARAAALGSVPLVLPTLLWLPLAAIGRLSAYGMDVGGPVPAWMKAWPFPVMGTCWLPLVGCLVLVFLVLRAGRTIGRVMAEKGVCASCGYDRRGLPAASRCPECGKASPPA